MKKIQPQQVHWLCQMLINSSRSITQAKRKIATMWSLKAWTISWTCQNLSMKVGCADAVNLRKRVMARNCFFVIYMPGSYRGTGNPLGPIGCCHSSKKAWMDYSKHIVIISQRPRKQSSLPKVHSLDIKSINTVLVIGPSTIKNQFIGRK